MYMPRHFEETRPEVLHELVRSHPLGMLITQDADAILSANPVPFLLEHDDGGRAVLRAHVARANPVWQAARRDVDSLVVFQGPQAYVSPGWYASKAEHGKVVPTWNYVMVQARGRLQVHEDAPWLLSLVTRLTQRHEAALPRPWAVADAPADFIDGMLRAIVGIEIPLDALIGKWKVSQNRSTADREGVAAGLREQGAASDGASVNMSKLVQPGG
ncbi:FMN-binding negative transcriptional regulator [Rhizobacter sp. OV335]|uniref:FMN-binding negative transcriptional regulator n=1 Tax=Rhizobacter sp. OV335 TaxID=1500264 RepID=UPI000915926A|nr:FMN-binding negative transcriptional regulator [Rhizobacter sp. OV335]SHM79780.1 negative transcriptional regulator, PaiB family [Rhizobacter sp. OV335]